MSSDKFTSVYVLDNLIPYPYYETTSTNNGITFTDNGDGTVTANGTATANAIFYCRYDESIPLAEGNYILSGCPEGGGSSTYRVTFISNNNGTITTLASDYGNGRTFTIDSTTVSTLKRIAIRIDSGQTVNNLLFKPMLERGSIAHDYISYANSRANNQIVTNIE